MLEGAGVVVGAVAEGWPREEGPRSGEAAELEPEGEEPAEGEGVRGGSLEQAHLGPSERSARSR